MSKIDDIKINPDNYVEDPGRRHALLFLGWATAALLLDACGNQNLPTQNKAPIAPAVANPTATAILAPQTELEIIGEIPPKDPNITAYSPEEIEIMRPQLERILAEFPLNSLEYYAAASTLGLPNAPKYAVLENGVRVVIHHGINHQIGTNDARSSISRVQAKDGQGDVLVVSSIVVPLVENLRARRSNKPLAEPEWLTLFLKESSGNPRAYAEVNMDPTGFFESQAAQFMPAPDNPIPAGVHPQIQSIRNISEWINNPTPEQAELLQVLNDEFLHFIDIMGSSYYRDYTAVAFPNRFLPDRTFGSAFDQNFVLEICRTAFEGSIRKEKMNIGLPNLAYALGGIVQK